MGGSGHRSWGQENSAICPYGRTVVARRKLKHLVDRLTTEGRERSGAPPATGGTATGGQSSGVATAETKRLARLKNILSHDIQSIERQSPQLAYQGMPGLVLPLRSLRPAARGVVPLLHPVVALPPAAAAPGTRR